ncbi:hypothetical protein [Ramlibacter sp.]|uniref:hypothetical protein n=1 Tax=Ramlibacter sp. TaxID=1917967 RepID=UPI003D0A6EB1
MKQRGNTLLALVLLLVAAIGLAALAYRAGAHHTDNAWKAKELKREQDARARELAEQRRGEKASGAYQAELLDARIERDKLEGAFNAYKRTRPLVAKRAVEQLAAVASEQQAAVAACEVLHRDDPALSHGAVWMWNSALLGRDAPSGTCGLADRSEGACDADAGIGLAAAWDNQALNAKLCAEDRHRHQRLIDFIKGKQQ